jgi:hypothetical protein
VADPRRARVRLACWVVAALLLSLPASGRASGWSDVARSMAAPWPEIQHTSGSMPDYLDAVSAAYGGYRGSRYGDAMLGYALLQTGLREGDARFTAAGVRALTSATLPGRVPEPPSVFEHMAVASAYNLTRANPELAGPRAQWALWLHTRTTVRLQYDDRYRGNHWLVDAVAVLELERTGLVSGVPGTILGSGAATARRRAVELINVQVPRMARAGRPFVLSDPPDNPIAYHGLSLGLYARAVHLLGHRAAPAARRTLRQAVRAAALMTAPNGDSSYFGRSQGQAWALSGTAYGALLAVALRVVPRREQASAQGVARRALARLRSAYPVTSRGQLITPALAADLPAGARGLDEYAGASDMAGLALALLNWTLDLRPDENSPAALPADRALRATISQDDGRFAVVRRGRTWFAVKMTRSVRPHQARDLRYDAGLALALRKGARGWRELVPQRPRNGDAGPPSAGPVLLGGAPRYFHGRSIDTRGDGSVRVAGDFRRLGGGRRRRPAAVVHRPTPCGVSLAFNARRADAYRLSAFFSRRPRISGRGAGDGFQTIAASADRTALRLAPGTMASGERAHLWRVAVTLHARTARRVGLHFRAARCAARRR